MVISLVVIALVSLSISIYFWMRLKDLEKLIVLMDKEQHIQNKDIISLAKNAQDQTNTVNQLVEITEIIITKLSQETKESPKSIFKSIIGEA